MKNGCSVKEIQYLVEIPENDNEGNSGQKISKSIRKALRTF